VLGSYSWGSWCETMDLIFVQFIGVLATKISG